MAGVRTFRRRPFRRAAFRRRRFPRKIFGFSWNALQGRVGTASRLAKRAPMPSLAIPSPFAPRIFRLFNWTEARQLVGGAAGVMGTEFVVRLNSLFDPDFGVGGHQPYGYDQLTGIYAKYKVNAVDIDLRIFNPGGSSAVVAYCVNSYDNPQVLTGFTIATVTERPNVETFPMPGFDQVVHIKRHFHMADVQGVSRADYKADLTQFVANIGANPLQTPQLRIAVGDINGNSNITVNIILTVTFYAEMHGRVGQGQS